MGRSRSCSSGHSASAQEQRSEQVFFFFIFFFKKKIQIFLVSFPHSLILHAFFKLVDFLAHIHAFHELSRFAAIMKMFNLRLRMFSSFLFLHGYPVIAHCSFQSEKACRLRSVYFGRIQNGTWDVEEETWIMLYRRFIKRAQ